MERIAVQPFHQNPKSGPVPLEDFDQCASAIAECEHTAGVRVEVEFQFDDCCQSGVAPAKVRYTARQIDGRTSGKVKHNSSKPEAGQPSGQRDNPLRSQSEYFSGDRWLQENFLYQY